MRKFNLFLKRTFDVIVSAIVLVFFTLIPVMIIVPLVIKFTSKGPAVFKQTRIGKNGKPFVMYKFRTMILEQYDENGNEIMSENRITTIGKFLRKTSLDELPQLFNVLKGDMSFIGPRPPLTYHPWPFEEYTDEQKKMFDVRPGITGWAQVNGFRGPTDELWKMEKRVEFDAWYAENWNFMLDLKIIFLTVVNAIRGDQNAI